MTKPASPSTEAPASVLACDSCGHEWNSPTVNLLTCGIRLTGEEWCKGTIRWRTPAPQRIERCSCAESIRLRAALEAITKLCVRTSDINRVARRALALEPEGEQ